MATWNSWIYPTASLITGTTKIQEADNKLQAGQADIETWTNGTGAYTGVGLNDYTNAFLLETFTSFTEDTVVVEW